MLFIIPALLVFIWGFAVIFDRVLCGIPAAPFRFLAGCMTGLLLSALATVAAGSQDVAQAPSVQLTIAMFVFIILIAATAIVTPLPLLDGVVSSRERAMMMLTCAIITLFFILALIINPESWAGGPDPLLADRLPLVGWAFDPLIGGPASETLFSLMLNFGFYIEVAFMAAVVCFLVRWGRLQRKHAGK